MAPGANRALHAEKDACWDETRRFAALSGIPDALLPRDWAGFEEYWQGMPGRDPAGMVVDRLAVLARAWR